MAHNHCEESFEKSYEKYHKPLVGYILARISGELSDAEDLAQNVWIEALENINKTPDEGGFDPARKVSFYTYLINRYAKFFVLRYNTASFKKPFYNAPARTNESFFRKSAYSELFRLTFLCGGYPHQQLVFGYSKHIYGKPSERGIEGASAKVVKQKGDLQLNKLLESYWVEYKSLSSLGTDELEILSKHIDPVRLRCALTAKELFRRNKKLYDHLEPVWNQSVGSTSIKDYYSSRGAAASISDWCYRVEERIRTVLGVGSSEEMVENERKVVIKQKTCNRCKLRDAPPCGKGQS
jgi:hypothetical protein